VVQVIREHDDWWGWFVVGLLLLIGVAIVMGEPKRDYTQPEPKPTPSAADDNKDAYRLGKTVGEATLAAARALERAERASRSAEREPVVRASSLPDGLLYIRSQESGGNYTAYNPTGCSDENGTFSCGGAYQLSEQYASAWAAEAGYPGMSSQAQIWPRDVQDAVALYKYERTGGGLWCDWTDYC
jgi:hypothetical protein